MSEMIRCDKCKKLMYTDSRDPIKMLIANSISLMWTDIALTIYAKPVIGNY